MAFFLKPILAFAVVEGTRWANNRMGVGRALKDPGAFVAFLDETMLALAIVEGPRGKCCRN